MKLQEKPTIAIDMDGVLADTERAFLDWYERETGTRPDPESLRGKAEQECLPDPTAVMRYVRTPGFFRTLRVIPGAKAALARLQERYDIYIVSAAMEFPDSLREKHDWLAEHFPAIDWRHIIFCGDKSRVHTDYLIDDHCKNLDFCAGKPLLFTAAHNVDIERHTRVNSWKEVLGLLLPQAVEAPVCA